MDRRGDRRRRIAHRVVECRKRPVTLPVEYARQHVRLGYAATEHGNQGDTVDVGIELATVATTQRGLYVGVSRGRRDNKILVVTESHDLDDARDILEYVLASDRADIPATTQRRRLAEMDARPSRAPRAALRDPAVARPASEQRRPRPRRSTIRVPDRAPQDSTRCSTDSTRPRPNSESPKGRSSPTARRSTQPTTTSGRHKRLSGRPTTQAMRAKGFKKRGLLRDATKAAIDTGRCASQPGRRRSCRGTGQEPCRRGMRDPFTRSRTPSDRRNARWIADGHEDRILWLGDLDASLDIWERWASGRSVADTDVVQRGPLPTRSSDRHLKRTDGATSPRPSRSGVRKRGLKLAPTIEVAAAVRCRRLRNRAVAPPPNSVTPIRHDGQHVITLGSSGPQSTTSSLEVRDGRGPPVRRTTTQPRLGAGSRPTRVPDRRGRRAR